MNASDDIDDTSRLAIFLFLFFFDVNPFVNHSEKSEFQTRRVFFFVWNTPFKNHVYLVLKRIIFGLRTLVNIILLKLISFAHASEKIPQIPPVYRTHIHVSAVDDKLALPEDTAAGADVNCTVLFVPLLSSEQIVFFFFLSNTLYHVYELKNYKFFRI